MVLEKALENPLDCKEIQPVHPKGNQCWIFIVRTDAEAETPIFWSLYMKSWLTGKDPDTGKDWRQKEKGTTEDEMVGWHHRRDGHEFEQILWTGDGQGSLACCRLWGCKESDMTYDWTDRTDINILYVCVYILYTCLSTHIYVCICIFVHSSIDDLAWFHIFVTVNIFFKLVVFG